MGRTVYLDNAATTKMSEGVLNAMLPYLKGEFGNASANYPLGWKAHEGIEEARKNVADLIGALPDEIIFTSGGTEADNMALRCGAKILEKERGKHIVTSKIEHPAVLNTCHELEAEGYDVTYVSPDSYGKVDPRNILKAIKPSTAMVSIMAANNEVGTINPLRTIGQVANDKGILFHTDAVQAIGHIPINVVTNYIDLLSASAHKFNGPKGIGFLYVATPYVSEIKPLICGGHQENDLRAGTENVAAIVGMGQAAKEAKDRLYTNMEYVSNLRHILVKDIISTIPGATVNGTVVWEDRLPNNLNIRFDGIDGTTLQYMLQERGICVSTGSACCSHENIPSHVLKALRLTDEQASSSIRLTLGHDTSLSDIDYTIDTLRAVVEELRNLGR